MPWIEIHIKTYAEHANELSDQLTEFGASAVTFQDAGNQPIYEPSPETQHLWQHTLVIGLFDKDYPLTPLISYLENLQALGGIEHFHSKHIEDEDWERRCLDHFKPMRFGKRLWICPSWQTPPDPEAVNVILDPGLAFGTGSHPTTALCLEWLDENITSDNLVIDYGCGSGILALAALKLGAKKVIAIDHDPQALEATCSNIKRSHIEESRLETYLPNKISNLQADILIANILAKPLIDLASYLSTLLKPQGKIVLSGILAEQANDVMEAYTPWVSFKTPVFKEEWTRLEGFANKKL